MSNLTDYLDGLDGLVGGWNLASTEGDDPDTSGNENDGVFVVDDGTRGAAAIEVGGAGSWNNAGSGDRVVVADDAVLQNIFDGGGTAFILCHPTSSPVSIEGVLLAKSPGWLLNQGNADRLVFRKQFSSNQGVWTAFGGNLSLDTSFAVAVVYDSGNTSNLPAFYVLNLSTEAVTTITNPTTSFEPIGATASDEGSDLSMGATTDNSVPFTGRLAVARLYSRALTEQEIEDAFAAALGAQNATITSVTATATASASEPGTSLSLASTQATASAAAHEPNIFTGTIIDSETAMADGAANAPGTSLALPSVAAQASAQGHDPTTSISLTLASVPASATGFAPVPHLQNPGPGEDFTIPGPPPEVIYEGTAKAVYAQFRDPQGDFYDPDVVQFKTRAPNGEEATYTMGVDSEVAWDAFGVYHLTFTVDQAGRWITAAKGEDEDAVGQVEFEALPSIF